jgi:predicted N-acetyltransferase YhbS
VRIEALNDHHDHSRFTCGKESLDKYLKFALQARRMGFGRTFVATEDDSNVVLGYYTRALNSVAGDLIPRSLSKNAVPVMLLAKFAVSNNLQRQGVGKKLLKHFLEAAIGFSENEACFAVIVDALDQEAKDYYLQFGFIETLDDNFRLYLPMKTVRKLVA